VELVDNLNLPGGKGDTISEGVSLLGFSWSVAAHTRGVSYNQDFDRAPEETPTVEEEEQEAELRNTLCSNWSDEEVLDDC